jgi:hypothetical protein
MADTGAPWNIPYVTPTDNPRVFPAADEAAALAIAAGLSAASFVKQIEFAVKTDTSSGSGTTYADIGGLSVTITPTSASSRILLLCSIGTVGAATDTSIVVRLLRDSTALDVGDADGNRLRGAFGTRTVGSFQPQTGGSIMLLDSPSTTSATVYKAQAAGSSSWAINSSTSTTNSNQYPLTISTLMAMEVQ